MSHVDAGALAGYNSLMDPNLAGYFGNVRMRKHLKKSGLVNRRGEIISESTYRLNMARKEHKNHVRDLLAQAIVHKTLDMERTRQVAIKQKIEEIAKVELVKRIRGERGRKGDEDILPYLTPRKGGRPSSVPAGGRRRSARPASGRPQSGRPASGRPASGRPQSGKQTHNARRRSNSQGSDGHIYIDDQGQPIDPPPRDRSESPDDVEYERSGSKGRKKSGKGKYPKGEVDDRHLYALDQRTLREYMMAQSHVERGRGSSPYTVPAWSGEMAPSPPSGSPRRSRTRNKPGSAKQGRGKGALHRQEPAMKHQERIQTLCEVNMHYFGSSLQLDYERFDPRDDVLVEQQHCGGNTLYVYKEKIMPGTDFTFTSRRHRGYPFSLTFYINGTLDCRLSTCCEFKHGKGSRLGGSKGHFGMLGVEGSAPCYKCQVAGGGSKKKEKKKKKKDGGEKRGAGEEETETVKVPVDDEDDDQKQETDRNVKVKGLKDDNETERDRQRKGDSVEVPVEDDAHSQTQRDEDEDAESEVSGPLPGANLPPPPDSPDSDEQDAASLVESQGSSGKPYKVWHTGSADSNQDAYGDDFEDEEDTDADNNRPKSRAAPAKGRGYSDEEFDDDDDKKSGSSRRSSRSSSYSSARSSSRSSSRSRSRTSSSSGDESARRDKRQKKSKRKSKNKKAEERKGSAEERRGSSGSERTGPERAEEPRREPAVAAVQSVQQPEREDSPPPSPKRARSPTSDSSSSSSSSSSEDESDGEGPTHITPTQAKERPVSPTPSDDQRKRGSPPPKAAPRKSPSPPSTPQKDDRKSPSPTPQTYDRKSPSPPSTPRQEDRKSPSPPSTPQKNDRKSPSPPSTPQKADRKSPSPPPGPSHVGAGVAPASDSDSTSSDTEATDRDPPQRFQVEGASGSPTPEERDVKGSTPPPDDRDSQQGEPAPARDRDSLQGEPAPARDRDSLQGELAPARDRDSLQGELAPARDRDSLQGEPAPARDRDSLQGEPAPAQSAAGEREAEQTSDKKQSDSEDSSSSSNSSDSESDSEDEKRKREKTESTQQEAQAAKSPEPDTKDKDGGGDRDQGSGDDSPRAFPPSQVGTGPGQTLEGSIRAKVEDQRDVDLSTISLNKQQVDELVELLKDCDAIEELSVRNCGLGDAEFEQVAESLQENAGQLKLLNLNCNKLTGKSARPLVDLLADKTEIEALLLNGVPLGDAGARTLVDGILTLHVKAAGDVITPEQMAAVKEAAHDVVSDVIRDVLASASMQTVGSTQSEASEGTQRLLSEMERREGEGGAPRGLALRHLDIGDSGITDAGMAQVARLVAANTGVTKLDLAGNRAVGVAGWRALGDAMRGNTQVRTLCLDYNRLGGAGLAALVEGLRDNRTLQSLDLESNKIDEAGGRLLLELVRDNRALCDVTLMPGNQVDDVTLEMIRRELDGRAPPTGAS